MPNAEYEQLLDAFLNGEVDAAGREQLAALLESDESVALALDEALRMEALLNAAHANPAEQSRGAARLAERIGARAPKKNILALPPRVSRPARAWAVVAALIAIMFSGALYYKYQPETKTDEKIGGLYAVASGRVWIDGREAREVAENDWINVSPDGPAALRSGNGVRMELEQGSGVLLRKTGATLLNGSGTFAVGKNAGTFEVDTSAGSVSLGQGEYLVKLQPAAGAANTKLAPPELSVSVLSGSADVKIDGTIAHLSAGDSRVFESSARGASKVDLSPKQKEHNGPGNPPPPNGPAPGYARSELLGLALDRADELKLSAEQRAQLGEIGRILRENRLHFEQDKQLNDLFRAQRDALDNFDEAKALELARAIRERENAVVGSGRILRDPMELLNAEQRRQLIGLREQTRPGGARPGPRPPPPPPRRND